MLSPTDDFVTPLPIGMTKRIFVSFCIDQSTGDVCLQYASSKDCELLSDFHSEVNSHESIEVDTELATFFADDAYLSVAKYLWQQLGDIPTDSDGVDGNIDEPFFHFPTGTPVYDIWHWFEDENALNISIAQDLMACA